MRKRIIFIFTSIVALLLICTYTTAQEKDTDFKSFLNKFTTSASFQYSRINFPMESSIILLDSKGEEQSFQFTKDKWSLLDGETFREERVIQEEGGVYVARFVLDEPDRKEFEAGYEEAELDLRIVFELKDGKWYATDCYNGWYSVDLPAEELNDTVLQVQELNMLFEEDFP